MPRNAAGTYTLPGAYNPVVADELITSEWANATLSDIASALTNSLDRYGNGGMIGSFRLADGTLGAPGLAFTNESNTGFARLSDAVLTLVVDATATIEASPSAVTFVVKPQTNLVPTDDADLVNRVFITDNYAPLLNPEFSAAGAPSWAGTPTLPAHLATKEYVDTLAFSAALPDSSGQPQGSVIAINDNGNPAWDSEQAEIMALSILNYLTS